jgi:hypothetical protein
MEICLLEPERVLAAAELIQVRTLKFNMCYLLILALRIVDTQKNEVSFNEFNAKMSQPPEFPDLVGGIHCMKSDGSFPFLSY